MSNTTPSKPVYAILLFTIGILLATGLTTALTWASLEADFYGFQRYSSNERLGGVSCPHLMTPNETLSVIVKVSNPSQKEITPIVRIDTSTTSVPDTVQEQLFLQPGQTQQMAQTISAKNIDLRFFVLAKAYRYPAYPLPSAEGTCGVMVLPQVPFLNGAWIFNLWLGLSLLLIPLGLWRLNEIGRQMTQYTKGENAARTLALVAMLGLFVSLQGLWPIGVLILALTLLLSVAILGFVLFN